MVDGHLGVFLREYGKVRHVETVVTMITISVMNSNTKSNFNIFYLHVTLYSSLLKDCLSAASLQRLDYPASLLTELAISIFEYVYLNM